MQKNLLENTKYVITFFVITYVMYVFFVPYFTQIFGSSIKLISLIFFIVSLIVFMLVSIRISVDRDLFYIALFPVIYLPIFKYSWTNFSEINLILTPIIGYVLSRNLNLFKKILILVFVVHFFAVVFESFHGQYIYTHFSSGIFSNTDRILEPSIYGDVGFRPKGIFSGPLDATSFCIFMALIFRDNKAFLFCILSLALLTNGRLAILCISVILCYEVRKNIKLMVILIVLACMYFLFQSSDSILNLMQVFNLEDGSNYYRIVFMYNGMVEFFNYDIDNILFGNSGYYATISEHGAESGFINILLNVGLFGFLFYILYFIKTFYFLISARSFGVHLVCIILLFFCLVLYRIEAGFYRGGMLWCSIFSIIQSSNSGNKSHG